MNVNDIVERAISDGILKTKGKTPENTMRARLSEHIRYYGKNSIFVRVDSNKFALREWNVKEYTAKTFTKSDKQEFVVCLRQDTIDKEGRFFGFSFDFNKYLNLLKNPKNIIVCDRRIANEDESLKQLVAYVIIRNKEGKILSYVRGNYTSVKDRLLKGVLCIGFGGHVNTIDYSSLFGKEDAGLHNAAIREVSEELKNIKIKSPKLIGVINDDSSPLGLNHFGFVYLTEIIEDDKTSISTELSINNLNYLTIGELNNKYSELEFWSQLYLKSIYENSGQNKVQIKEKSKQISYPIVIVGEIGSGKTEIAKLISKKLNYEFISTRKVVSELIQVDDFGTGNREEFQNEALSFIKNNNGSIKIAEKILNTINQNQKLVIDGIRYIDTYDFIKRTVPSTTLIYIDAPADNSFEYYKKRESNSISIHDFRNTRYHVVEKEIVLFKNRADIYIYNGSSIENLLQNILDWLDEKK